MKIIKAVLGISLTIISISSYAKPNDPLYEAAEGLAKCAAFKNTLAINMTNSDAEYKEHFLHGSATGAKIASSHLMKSLGYKDEFTESIYQGAFLKYQNLVQLGGLNQFLADSSHLMTNCKNLNELQVAIITELRKQVYAQ